MLFGYLTDEMLRSPLMQLKATAPLQEKTTDDARELQVSVDGKFNKSNSASKAPDDIGSPCRFVCAVGESCYRDCLERDCQRYVNGQLCLDLNDGGQVSHGDSVPELSALCEFPNMRL